MSRQVQAMFSLLLIMATRGATGFAHIPPTPSPELSQYPRPTATWDPRPISTQNSWSISAGDPRHISAPGIPGLRPPVDPTEIAKCRSSLQSIPGCAQEIITTIFTSKFSLGPACCKAFVEVDEKCLLKLFPLFPSISALLKNNCAQVNAAPPNASGSN
ncbi:hypothetical protein ACFX1S_024925 [Malus domestica]